MSKHSKWAKIKNDKGAADVKKGAVFTKHSRAISVAARSGGDPEKNFKLRMAMDSAKIAGVPKDTIERAVARGLGTDGEEELSEMLYECVGPGKIGIMIEAVTNNKNRTVNDLRRLLEEHGGVLAQSGAVTWQFQRLGVARLSAPKDDELELKLIDLGAEDIKEEEGGLTIYTKQENWQKLLDGLRGMNLMPEYAGLEWVAKEPIAVNDPSARAQLDELYAALDGSDDVQNYFTSEA
ncbi:MAG: YebC/PmpR family DNA-binding transcriptional regulator [Candidatus Magasanikbacteria bacterium]|nr:YebC/PmpR family DNA-binding transcriptional regulator [Candidatus Magasanikbacteria bacterium]